MGYKVRVMFCLHGWYTLIKALFVFSFFCQNDYNYGLNSSMTMLKLNRQKDNQTFRKAEKRTLAY